MLIIQLKRVVIKKYTERRFNTGAHCSENRKRFCDCASLVFKGRRNWSGVDERQDGVAALSRIVLITISVAFVQGSLKSLLPEDSNLVRIW